MSFNSNLSNTTRIAPFNLDFEVDSTCTTVPPAVQLSTDASSIQIDSITVSSSSKNCSDSTGTAAATVEKTSLLPHLPIAKKKSKKRRNKKAQHSGYHPRCLPRSITENKKPSYHLRIEKILSDKSLQLFRPQLLCEVSNIQSNSENQLQLHFNSKSHQSSVWKLRNIVHLLEFSADFKQLSCGKHINPRKNIKNALALKVLENTDSLTNDN